MEASMSAVSENQPILRRLAENPDLAKWTNQRPASKNAA